MLSKLVEQKIRYKDSCLRSRDITSLQQNYWLTAEAIYFGLNVLEQKIEKTNDPSLATLIIFEDDDENIIDAIAGGELLKYDYLIIPVNTSMQFDKGEHWVTLIYYKISNEFYFIDSKQGSINQIIKTLIQKLQKFIGKDIQQESHVFTIEKLQYQENSFDCGVYVLCYIEKFIEYLQNKSKIPDDLDFTDLDQNRISQKRQSLNNIINDLRNLV